VPVRPRPAVEAVAYFTIAEALTNIAKHSRASQVRVVVDGGPGPAGTLNIVVSDDGIGGADAAGAGLSGLADRIAGIDGTLFKEVGFGWGILGHLNRGGRFIVQQQDVGDNVWEISSMTLNFTGKILVFKNLTINSKEVFSDFKPIPPNLTFAQGVDLLKKEQSSETADNCCRPSIAQEAK